MGLPHPSKEVNGTGKQLKWFGQAIIEVLLLLGLWGIGFWPLHIWNIAFTGYIACFFPRPVKDLPLQYRLAWTAACFVGAFMARTLLWILLVSNGVALVLNYDFFVRMLSLLPINRYEPFSAKLVMDTFTASPKEGRFSAGKRPDI
uniref:Glycerophosphocholine acyltransferase 1 n=1 Tax=Eutreptiella gymnastica TaxID=73025 RepID=A0A7S4GI58_9EUGL